MQFILTPDTATATSDLQARLLQELSAGKKVVWLVSGGSNIDISVAIMANIPGPLQSLLTVMFIDERYGPVGHADSNFEQLIRRGFEPEAATLIPLLQAGLSLEATALAYGEVLQLELTESNVVIAQLGIGGDGHTAGILPQSQAAKDGTDLVTSYNTDQFDRITLTFTGLRSVTAAYVLAYGGSKKDALLRLQQTEVALAEQPAQIYRQIPESYIYNDQIGDTL